MEHKEEKQMKEAKVVYSNRSIKGTIYKKFPFNEYRCVDDMVSGIGRNAEYAENLPDGVTITVTVREE